MRSRTLGQDEIHSLRVVNSKSLHICSISFQGRLRVYFVNLLPFPSTDEQIDLSGMALTLWLVHNSGRNIVGYSVCTMYVFSVETKTLALKRPLSV